MTETPRQRQIRELDDLLVMAATDLDGAYKAGWDRWHSWKELMEALTLRLISRTVREHAPNATAIKIEPTDQGGDGWTLADVIPPNDSVAWDDLLDDDRIGTLLSDLGVLMPSSEHATNEPYRLELESGGNA